MDAHLLISVFLNITLEKLTEKSNSIQKSKFKSNVLHCKLEILDRLLFQNSTFHFGTILFPEFITFAQILSFLVFSFSFSNQM